MLLQVIAKNKKVGSIGDWRLMFDIERCDVARVVDVEGVGSRGIRVELMEHLHGRQMKRY
jgi:hypothetical protein